MVTVAMKFRHLLLGRKAVTNLNSVLEGSHYFANKDITLPFSQSCGFPSSLIWMWELDYKESWVPEELLLLNCGAGEDFWEFLGV